MRRFVAALAAIVVLMVAFVAYFFVGGTLKTEVSVQRTEASRQTGAFEALKGVIADGNAPQVFDNEDIADINAYRLMDVTVSLKNIGLFAAEWLEIEVTPGSGDVAVYSLEGAGTDIASMAEGEVNLKLITKADAGTVRTVTVGYYVLGMHRSIRIRV